MTTIVGLDVREVRFPTSRELDGSDAMNPDPDYSAAYVVVRTSGDEEGHGFVFTIGRGNDVQTAAIAALEHLVVGLPVDEVVADMGAFARLLVRDRQLRWLGPEKGVIHMAIGAVVNAVWDLRCRREGKPLWKLLSDLTPEELVDLVDFRYLTDVLDPDRTLDLVRAARPGLADREQALLSDGFPAYTTSPGWLGYDDEKLARLCRDAVAEGFDHVKLKVGADLADDVRRCRLARQVLGPDLTLSVDANQRGTSPRRSAGCGSWRRSGSTGSRSRRAPTSPDEPRRAPTTCWATSRCARRWPRSGWRPASTCRTG